jgi:hypothetical protein
MGDEALTVAEFILDPSIPPKERKYFEKFYVMFTNIMALGNIKRQDVFALLIAFEEICMLMEMGLYEEARNLMGRELMKMQVSRSVDGFQTLFGQQGIQRTEHIERVIARTRGKKGFIGRLGGLFGKKEQEEPLDMQEVGGRY